MPSIRDQRLYVPRGLTETLLRSTHWTLNRKQVERLLKVAVDKGLQESLKKRLTVVKG